jgi:hypothetical protein
MRVCLKLVLALEFRVPELELPLTNGYALLSQRQLPLGGTTVGWFSRWLLALLEIVHSVAPRVVCCNELGHL